MEIREITSLQNEIIKHIVHLRQNHDYRNEHQTVVISGLKMIKEVTLHVPIKTLFVYDKTFIPKGLKAENIYLVNEKVMQKASGLQNPEGILAEVQMPKTHDLNGLKKIVVLDRISDPGNLGNILRTALALNFDGAFVVEDSTDPYNDKALSAARGATFKLPIARGSWKELEKLIDENGLQAYAGDIKGTSLDQIKPSEKILLVLSNEAHGVSKEAAKNCEMVTIPISSEMESLNVSVAAGILMYVLGK